VSRVTIEEKAKREEKKATKQAAYALVRNARSRPVYIPANNSRVVNTSLTQRLAMKPSLRRRPRCPVFSKSFRGCSNATS
jgi:hypothetical protein